MPSWGVKHWQIEPRSEWNIGGCIALAKLVMEASASQQKKSLVIMLSTYVCVQELKLKHTDSYRVNVKLHEDKTLNSVEYYEEW